LGNNIYIRFYNKLATGKIKVLKRERERERGEAIKYSKSQQKPADDFNSFRNSIAVHLKNAQKRIDNRYSFWERKQKKHLI